MHFLAMYCLPHTGNEGLRCCTEFISADGHKYRAHPSIYDGRPWHDHAMVELPNYKFPHPLPASIDLQDLPPILRDTPRVKAGAWNRRYLMNVWLFHLPISRIVSQGTPARYMAIAVPARIE
jgi:hypothetical protein